MTETSDRVEPGSFRDPAGFIFERDGEVFRQINPPGQGDYEALLRSGLYDELSDLGLLIPHEEVRLPGREAFTILRVERIPFVSYPYEWCFSAWRDAALLTLEIQKKAVLRGLCLKDASAFNVQFRGCRPVFIDTLSFEPIRDDRPWVAYRQFCRHFLAPLAMMAKTDARFSALFRVSLDGIPLDLAAKLLPRGSSWSWGLFLHLFLHARMESRHGGSTSTPKSKPRFGRNALLGLVGSLERAIRKLSWEPRGTEWIDYVSDTNYTDADALRKRELVGEMLDECRPATLWDLGANTGEFSRLASGRGIATVSMDVDPACVEANYRDARLRDDGRMLPLRMDLFNPSPGLGWAGRERKSLTDRGPADAVMALALVHHLAIAGNIPLPRIAETLSDWGEHLIIEFVPKSDSQVARLLVVREDVFPDYTREGFEAAFAARFALLRAEPVGASGRILYLMKRHDPA